ncbi:PA0069 family radical SAM protein [Pedobacter sp. SD-b]|uniref:PA0069 family radical SAM protein n=1 Tax=Pedobacter segetis TaxID=2793069 RepID=A0ABS1BJL0_9SPHI|nr:PA0069 family radical SAM protein [Pedobacter segetis]MBK0383056.1 PA0069 family radical SAM protein [Pedobacter segetis]
MEDLENGSYFKGRGSQSNPNNKFHCHQFSTENIEGLDEPFLENSLTEFIKESPKKIISVSNSPDIPFLYSINPYQGCEHGCIYCYARNAHEYWGFSAGLDFERKIIYKPDAAEILEKQINHKNYQPQPIMLSGNTDCYQPAERKFKITQSLLKVFLKYKHPVSIITKNSLILRDLDLLEELNKLDLIHINISVTSLNEELRQKLEPRTVTGKVRIKVIEKLAEKNIPVRVMVAPIIPGLNSDEIPNIIKAVANAGATDAGFTIVRLNGAIADIFEDWILKAYPDRAQKVLGQIAACHGGSLNDSRWGTRMKGEGNEAEAIRQLFKLAVKKYMPKPNLHQLSLAHFHKREEQLKLF